jgi:hypothetical protein
MMTNTSVVGQNLRHFQIICLPNLRKPESFEIGKIQQHSMGLTIGILGICCVQRRGRWTSAKSKRIAASKIRYIQVSGLESQYKAVYGLHM